MNRLLLQVAVVGWPAFLAAGVIDMFVFAFVEPASLHGFSGGALEVSATAVYSIAFLVFWVLVAAANVGVLWLMRSADEINATDRASDGSRG